MTEIQYPPLDTEDPSGWHNCLDDYRWRKVASPANSEDWNQPGSVQGYQVYECMECGDVWGLRYQWDAGTGDDDNWKRFGAIHPSRVKRHY